MHMETKGKPCGKLTVCYGHRDGMQLGMGLGEEVISLVANAEEDALPVLPVRSAALVPG